MTSKYTAVLKIKRYVQCLKQTGVLYQTDNKMVKNRADPGLLSHNFLIRKQVKKQQQKKKHCCSAVLCFAMM